MLQKPLPEVVQFDHHSHHHDFYTIIADQHMPSLVEISTHLV